MYRRQRVGPELAKNTPLFIAKEALEVWTKRLYDHYFMTGTVFDLSKPGLSNATVETVRSTGFKAPEMLSKRKKRVDCK